MGRADLAAVPSGRGATGRRPPRSRTRRPCSTCTAACSSPAAASPALRLGAIDYPDGAPDGVLAWHRTAEGADHADRRTILVNQLDAEVVVPAPLWDGLVVEVASDGIGEGGPFDGVLRADAALVLRPA